MRIKSYQDMEEHFFYSMQPTKQECDTLSSMFNQFAGVPVKTVLDLGCGYGRHSIELARRGYEVVGFDYSANAIQMCKSKTEDQLNPQFLVLDMRHIGLRDGIFDSVFSHNSVIAHLLTNEEVTQVLDKIYKLTRKDGIFVFDYFYPMNLVRAGQYLPQLAFTLEVDDLTLRKESRHELDTERQIHHEESVYIVTEGENDMIFEKEEHLRYFEPEQISGILRMVGFGRIHIFDRIRHYQIDEQTHGLLVVAQKN